LIARSIHNISTRFARPLVKLNCAALPFDLLESELFGHEKGAFTGAIAQKKGRFEMAHTGSLFLDEIGDIPLASQPKLLRVLQEQEFERLGSGETHQVDVRLIAATHRDLNQMAKEKEFRSDLYYRLNVFPIFVPPLRERREDIIPLVWHFVDAFSRRLGKTIKYIAAETLNAFQLHDWPGNIRELQNVIERAIILSKDGVLPNLLTPCGCEPLPVNATESGLWQMERMLILRTLRETDWVVGGPDGAAVKLGVKRTTLTAKLKKLGISRPDPQTAIR
jgi:transcriptional regulator with GAF, ATPase, and Fis domain